MISVAVPSLNQGQYLDACLDSIISQELSLQVLVADGGSTDCSVEIIKKKSTWLNWWRSRPDRGQAAAINEAVSQGSAPYVCWLNADDFYLPGGLVAMLSALQACPGASAVYGQCWTVSSQGRHMAKYLTFPFFPWLLARYCFIAQPATLIRRDAWNAVGGLDESLHMAMDYDLWWRLFKYSGNLIYLRKAVAGTRIHPETKTTTQRAAHYRESMVVVRRHYGKVPWKWYLAWPLMVSCRQKISNLKRMG